jgi:bisanhydrobacterioruberin hydratase
VLGLFRVLLVWYAVWLAVGLGLAFYELTQWPVPYATDLFPFGHLEDLVFLALAAVLLGLWLGARVGGGRAGLLFAWVALGSGGVEWVGVHQGWPFGEYHYTGHLGPELAGSLPLAVPLAWWVIMLPAYLSAQAALALIFAPKKNSAAASSPPPAESPWPRRLLAVATALGAVAMDFALEPAAEVRRYWLWTASGPWYGVPWQNFWGWAGVALVLALGMQLIAGKSLREGFRPGGPALLLPMLLPVTVLLPFWIDLTSAAAANLWVSVLLISGLTQTMLWTRYLPPVWRRALWAGPPHAARAASPGTNTPGK